MSKKDKTFDVIVVGSGITGGWAAKEFTEKGLKTLVLERGRNIKHPNYPQTKNWRTHFLGDRPSASELKKYPVQSRTGFLQESNKHWWVNDLENPYTEEKRFDWIRGYHVGGRSITWGRQCYRLSDLDFEANHIDGIGVDWPIRYRDIEPWYDYVEKSIGVSGQKEGLAHFPDGIYQSPMPLNDIELRVRKSIAERFQRTLTIGRVAHLTDGLNGSDRSTCINRNECQYGCPRGAYFSSVSATLPAAERTGNLTLLTDSITYEISFDDAKQRATGVKVLNQITGEIEEYFARTIFLCASALASTQIMMNSISSRFPQGFGNDSGELGCNLMDHHLMVGANGVAKEFNLLKFTRRANGIFIPRYQNIGSDKRNYIRGFSYQGGASPEGFIHMVKEATFLSKIYGVSKIPDTWKMYLMGFGEMLPNHDNHVTLNQDKKDKYGLPTLSFNCELKENESKMRIDMRNDAAEMLEASGMIDIQPYDEDFAPGLAIHEMGTARMGRDPLTSVLNGWNQVHACKNVFVTDGACMTSSAAQGPSLTYMALTARAANFAVEEMKRLVF